MSKDMREIFHSIMEKFMYLEERARPNIEMTIAFLCTGVYRSDVDDWKKLKRVIILFQHVND